MFIMSLVLTAIVSGLVCFHLGDKHGNRQGSLATSHVASTFATLFETLAAQAGQQANLFMEIIKGKDLVIESKATMLAELTKKFEEMQCAFSDMSDEDDDEDFEESEHAMKNVTPSAQVALELYDTLQTGKHVLHNLKGKMSSDAHELLTAILASPEDKSNAN